jgi:hypothetical protein
MAPNKANDALPEHPLIKCKASHRQRAQPEQLEFALIQDAPAGLPTKKVAATLARLHLMDVLDGRDTWQVLPYVSSPEIMQHKRKPF